MAGSLEQELAAFATATPFRGKGPLSVALVVTQHARKKGLPLDPETLLTRGGGQVLGLGKGAVQAILRRYGITSVLAREGGRTSRGSLQHMRAYVSFLNDLHAREAVDLDVVESFWIQRVRQFFADKPFRIQLDSSRSLRTVVRELLAQAVERQRTAPGVPYAGAVLQHLVGAKLDCALGTGSVRHNSFSTADAPQGRAGDFVVGDVAIHVTTAPGEAVIDRCLDNLNDGLRPVIVTLQRGVGVAEGLAANVGLADRIDIFECEQFVALNLYELGRFVADGRTTAMTDLVRRYNQVVEEFETDPSLRVELRR
jgi:hypothetical protein